MRLDYEHYFLTMARVASLRSICNRRKVGAVLTDDRHRVLSTGYNGPASGLDNCNPCRRETAVSGTGLDNCMAVHAEINALIQCPDINRIHTLYVTVSPCFQCIKPLLNTPCQKIVFIHHYPNNNESKLIWERMRRSWVRIPFAQKDIDILDGLHMLGRK